ncbi:LysR family transcriptional regulator [Entomobacter blattae]|uniref:HTH-type transcriptional activator CmpR n=1 Tax=Entomobacter blattae TaxID=2762277 RepID=A0A7H1NU86_9PROT|nr:LysR family transcriptional regulator [Entomobacter blattae]QNT79346.1 HTH-type transcriptional activator CmpR [Entomobacter blattae]
MIVFSRFLLYFIEVARVGSIRKASETLNVAASAINRHILNVEDILGLPLFERLPTGLRLTSAGEMLLERARSWNKEYDLLQSQIQDLKGLQRGHAAFGVIDALSYQFSTSIIHKMHEEYPGIAISVNVLGNADIARKIIDGELDMGIMLNPHSSRDIIVHSFFETPHGIVTRPDHPLAERKKIRFSDAADYPMILPKAPLFAAEYISILENASGTQANSVATSNHIRIIKSLINSGIGISLLSTMDVMEEIENKTLCFIPLAEKFLKPMTVGLCVLRSRQLSKAALLLLARFENRFAQILSP